MQKETSNHSSDVSPFPMQKIVSQLDARGFLVGPVLADASPLGEPGEYLIPGGAIDRAPPDSMEVGRIYYVAEDGGWGSMEDLRQRTLYQTADGEPYTVGTNVDGRLFDGLGPCPDWLTLEPRPNTWSKWDGSAWVTDEALKASELTRLRSEEKMAKLMHAGQMILPLQDAQNLGVAAAEELDLLERWMRYRIALARVNPTDHEADWPEEPV